MAKTGRPLKAEEPRNKTLQIRLTQSEFDMIEKKANQVGLTKTEFILESCRKA